MNKRLPGSAGLGIGLGFFLVFSLAMTSPAEDKIVIKTENGIPVVYNPNNPAPPPQTPRSLTLQPDLTIGEDDTDPNSMFSELRSVQVDDQGNIYTLDMKEIKIKVFDKNGKFLRSFGKKGKGPGEIETPIRMEMTRDGKIVIDDMGNNKLIFFGPDGSCIKELTTGKYWALIRFKLDSKGNIYADTRTYEETKMTSELRKFDPEFKPLAAFASFEEKRPDRRNVSAFSPSFSLQVRRDDLLVYTIDETDKYEFTVVNTDGKTVKRILKEHEPVKITGTLKDKLIEESWGEEGIPADVKFDIPGHFPAVYYFIIDDEDRLFVCTYAYEEKEDDYRRYYDVFDSEGRYIAKFCHPRREMVFQVKKGKLYCMVQESEEGIPLVKRYDMIWK
jgi:6-bladed beta-propeller